MNQTSPFSATWPPQVPSLRQRHGLAVLVLLLHCAAFAALAALPGQSKPAPPMPTLLYLAMPEPAAPIQMAELPTKTLRPTAARIEPPPPVLASVAVPQQPPSVAAITATEPAAMVERATQGTPPVTATERVAPEPAAAVPPEPRTLASGAEFLRPPRPVYPALARRLQEQGKVMLRVLITPSGVPERAEVEQSSGSPRLDEAARLAALGALFKPHTDAGRAVAVYVLVPIRFQLET